MSEKQLQRKQFVTVQFAQPAWSATTSKVVPTLQFDQLNVIAHHMHAIKTGENLWTDPLSWPTINDDSLFFWPFTKAFPFPKLHVAEPKP
jgi:hypothetical protein